MTSFEELDEGSFESKVSNGHWLVLFASCICSSCQRMEKLIIEEDFQKQYSNLHFGRIELPNCPWFKEKFNVKAAIAILFSNGKELCRTVGWQQVEGKLLHKQLKKFLANEECQQN